MLKHKYTTYSDSSVLASGSTLLECIRISKAMLEDIRPTDCRIVITKNSRDHAIWQGDIAGLMELR